MIYVHFWAGAAEKGLAFNSGCRSSCFSHFGQVTKLRRVLDSLRQDLTLSGLNRYSLAMVSVGIEEEAGYWVKDRGAIVGRWAEKAHSVSSVESYPIVSSSFSPSRSTALRLFW